MRNLTSILADRRPLGSSTIRFRSSLSVHDLPPLEKRWCSVGGVGRASPWYQKIIWAPPHDREDLLRDRWQRHGPAPYNASSVALILMMTDHAMIGGPLSVGLAARLAWGELPSPTPRGRDGWTTMRRLEISYGPRIGFWPENLTPDDVRNLGHERDQTQISYTRRRAPQNGRSLASAPFMTTPFGPNA
jgi:hypothetical protein